MSGINLTSLIYVSSKFQDDDEDEGIVAVSTPRNRSLGVTGALASTSLNYVQILEGAPSAIAELMGSIRRDDRHSDVKVLREWTIYRRAFPAWSLAYSGPASYMARHVGDLIWSNADTLNFRINQFIKLLSGLSRP